jgi:acetolactate synthase small subunit
LEPLRKGDFVWFTYETKEVYPGRIVDIEKDTYIVEICTNKKKSSGNELERVKGKREQLELRVIGL